jgi:hypothetical protein
MAKGFKKVSPTKPGPVPQRRYYGEAMSNNMLALTLQAENASKILAREGHKGRSVMGFKLPIWQRERKWDDEMSALFIKNVYLGVNIGFYLVNHGFADETFNVLIDGQQRMLAIEAYLNDAFPVQGEDGKFYFWSQLDDENRAYFFRMPFSFYVTKFETDAEMREAYNCHNYTGVRHEEHERA